jgi:hypothetical protein
MFQLLSPKAAALLTEARPFLRTELTMKTLDDGQLI